jgi:uncharacterized small protein (DUF1192 family)
MNPDEIDPKPQAPKPKDLETMSLKALEEYIGELEAEIGRIREVIARKHSARSSAESVFRK